MVARYSLDTAMFSNDRLVILDADGTLIDAFSAIATTFSAHGMNLGDLERFQKRHNLFKYLGGAKEFPSNLKKQLTPSRRSILVRTLTEVYREHGRLYPGMVETVRRLQEAPDVRVGVVTRNITIDPGLTLSILLQREGVDARRFDFLECLPLKQGKLPAFNALRERFRVNPSRAIVCGDEHKDYAAAIAAGFSPIIGCYGFENRDRLARKFQVPEAVLCDTPEEMVERLEHALGTKPEADQDLAPALKEVAP